MLLRHGQFEIIISIACDHHAGFLLSNREDLRIGRVRRENIAEHDRFMAVSTKRIRDRIVNIVVEKKLHCAGGSI